MTTIINIGTSKKLFQIVQQLAFEAGFNWSTFSNNTDFTEQAFNAYAKQGVSLHCEEIDKTKRLMYGYVVASPHFDARTNFEAVVSWFDRKPPVIMTIKTHKIEINQDGTIVFGCTTLSSDEVEQIIEKRKKHIRK